MYFQPDAPPFSLATFLTNLKKKLCYLLETSSAEKNTQPLCHAGGLHISILIPSLREQQPDARVCKEKSCLSAQQLPAELLSHTFSLHWVHTAPTQSTCHFIWDGWEERRRGEGQKKNVHVHPEPLL